MTITERKRLMVEYLQVKVAEEDWHGVADAAMDLRDIESEIVGIERVRKELNFTDAPGFEW